MRRLSLSLLLLFSILSFPQAPQQPAADGVYEVPPSALQKLDSSPKVEFPRELAAYEIEDTVVVALSIAPDGTVEKAKVVSGRLPLLKEVAEKTAKHWAFQPYLVNGAAVRVRTEITFHFNNTLDHYVDEDGKPPAHLSSAVSQGRLLQQVKPQYPVDARMGRIQGQVVLRAIIGKDGHVRRLHVLNGHPMLAAAAFNAVRQWVYKPYEVNGVATEVDTQITVSFTLSG